MEIYIVRHGDPDYAHDSLTEKGEREAQLLARRLSKIDFKAYYCSPLGRAQETASYTLQECNKESVTLDWLREFQGSVKKGLFKKEPCWDRLPSYWTKIDDYYSYDRWHTVKLMKKNGVYNHYRDVCRGIDSLLYDYGYSHEGRTFKVIEESSDKIVLFCHFGVEAVIMSHIFGISPMILWHNFKASPTSVTRLVTEEREKGTAIFTCLEFGSLSHLYAAGEEPSFAGRFCEKFSDHTRH